jgi:hypothetical protein
MARGHYSASSSCNTNLHSDTVAYRAEQCSAGQIKVILYTESRFKSSSNRNTR